MWLAHLSFLLSPTCVASSRRRRLSIPTNKEKSSSIVVGARRFHCRDCQGARAVLKSTKSLRRLTWRTGIIHRVQKLGWNCCPPARFEKHKLVGVRNDDGGYGEGRICGGTFFFFNLLCRTARATHLSIPAPACLLCAVAQKNSLNCFTESLCATQLGFIVIVAGKCAPRPASCSQNRCVCVCVFGWGVGGLQKSSRQCGIWEIRIVNLDYAHMCIIASYPSWDFWVFGGKFFHTPPTSELSLVFGVMGSPVFMSMGHPFAGNRMREDAVLWVRLSIISGELNCGVFAFGLRDFWVFGGNLSFHNPPTS